MPLGLLAARAEKLFIRAMSIHKDMVGDDISNALKSEVGYINVRITVKTNAAMDELTGYDEGKNAVLVNVKASSDAAKVNKAVIELFSALLELPKDRIAVVEGTVDELKTIRVKDEARYVATKIRQAAFG